MTVSSRNGDGGKRNSKLEEKVESSARLRLRVCVLSSVGTERTREEVEEGVGDLVEDGDGRGEARREERGRA